MLLKYNSAFRFLFLSRISDVFAGSVIFFSLLKLIELQSNGTGAFTFFYIAYYLPVTFFALPIGAWISDKTLQKVMAYSNIIRVAVIIIFFLFMPFSPYQWAYLLLMIVSILDLFFMPANQSLLPHIVENENRPSANSLLQLGLTAVKILGQIFTALMIKLSVSPPILLIVSAVLLFLSFIFIKQIKPHVKIEQEEKKRPSTLMHEGLTYILTNAKLKLLFSFLTEILAVGVENLSFIGTSSLIGIAIGAMFAPKWYRRFERKWLIISPLFALCVSIASLIFITNWLLILPLFFIQGIAVGCYQVTIVTYLQDTVPMEHLTRTFSLFHMISSSMALPGVLLIGVLLNKIGVLSTIGIFSAILFIIGISGIFVFPRLGKGYMREHVQAF